MSQDQGMPKFHQPATNAPTTICLTFDVDTISIWAGAADATAFSRGEFGVVGTRRILRLLAERGIHGTFFVPGLTARTYPELMTEIVAAGHEIGHHGDFHESPARLDRDAEREVLAAGTATLERIAGVTPVGWRSPAWFVSPHSVELLLEAGFSYDSSLMGHDVQPYWCRTGDSWGRGQEVAFGDPCDLVELPIAWHLDDFPWFEYIPPKGGNMTAPSTVLEVWRGDFDFAHHREPGGTLTYTMHPQVIGRGHRMLMLEAFIDHVQAQDNVRFMPLDQVATEWRRDQGSLSTSMS
jgi:peptidoglycan-N-acetylglucosamine deacetylase